MADMMEQNGKDLYGSLQDIQEKTVARGRQLSARYGWKPVRIPVQEEAVGQVIGTSGNPVEDSYRYNSAIAFSQYYGISLPDAMKNLDSLYEAQTGKQYEPNATAWQSIVNSFTVGTRTVDLQAHKNEWRKAVLSGDTQRASTLEKEITDEEEYLASLADYAPRSWVTKALQWTANTLPYTVMTGAGAGLIGAAVGGAVSLATGGLALPAVIAAGTVSGLATKAATFGITEPLFEGDTFWDLKHQDVVGADGQAHRIEIDNDVAANLARWDGIFNAAIESELGIGSKLAGMIGGGVLSKAVQETLGSLMARGVTSRILLSIGKAVMDGAGEAAQEGMEELVDTGSRALAYQLSGYVPRDTVEATAKRALTAAGQAWVSSMIMGLPVSGIQVAANIGDARRMVADAKGDSRSLFVSKHLTAKPEGVSYTKWFKSLNGMYDRYHKGEAGGDENTESFHRLENGKLYATEEIVSPKNEQGVETRRYLIGDPEVEDGKRGAQYGAIDFELSDNGNRLTITDVSMGKGHEDLTVEAVTDLIDEYSKADVAWDTNGNEQLQAVKDSLMEQNNGSLQLNSPDQVQGHQKVVNAISRAFGSSLNNKQLYTAADVLEAMAQTKGMTGEQYLAKYFANGGFQKLSSAEGQAVLRQSGMSEGDVNGLTQFVTDGKAIVYAAEHGNFSTFVHESFHVLERVTDSTGNLVNAIKDASQSGKLAEYVKSHDRLFSDGLFTTDDEGNQVEASKRITDVVASWEDGKELSKEQQEIRSEIMARLFEGYLYDGKTFSPKLQTIFAKIAQWMRRIYRGMQTHGVTLTDDIVRAYDDLLTRKDSGLARAERAGGTVLRQQAEDGKVSAFSDWLAKADVSKLNGSKTYQLVSKQVPSILVQYYPEMAGLPLKIRERTIPHSLNRHPGMTVDIIRKALESINDPLAIGESKTVAGSPVILTDVLDRNGAHVIVPIHLEMDDGSGLCVVASVYGKDHGFDDWVASTNWVYKNKNKAPLFLDVIRSNSLDRGGNASIDNIASNHDSVKPDVLAQAAYHGSAYLFDKFRTDKVNSGEGSQYFGWGLYFTQSKQIAAEYAQRQGDLKFKDGGRVAGLPDLLSVMGGSESLKKFEDTVDRISGKPGRWKEVLDNFCVGIGASDNDILQAIDYASFETRPEGNTFKEMMASRSSGLTGKENAVKAALEDFLNTEEGLRFYDLSHTWGRRPHYVYSVELPDGKYLDWNAPMPEEDRQLIRSRFLQESGESLPDEIDGDPELDRPDNKFKTGRDFYRGLREMPYFRGEPRDISGFLHRLGYAGIVYDAGSIQGGGNGARNLVVFDENDIRITGKTLFQRVTAEQVQKARTRDMERIEKDAREALIRTAGGGTRLMDIARECQSFEEFRDKVSDEFVRGQERIPRMSLDDFARTTWDYMRMLDGGDLYGDHELSEAARDAGSAEAFGEWLAEHRPDLEESLKGGNDTTLEAWLRALYQEANGTAEGNEQEATNATAILNEERRKRREKSLDGRFLELVDTDEGLEQVISAFSDDDTQLPPEARIVVEAAGQEEIDAAREALKRDPRLYRTLYAEKTGNEAWKSSDIQGDMPMIGDPVGRMRYIMGESERKRRLSARGLANKQLADALRTGDMKYLNGITDEIMKKAQDEISRLEDQVREARRQGKKDTDQAVRDLKRQISEKEAEKREARRQRQYMQSLADFITRPVPQNVDIDTALEIQMLVEKSGIDPHFRNGRAKFQGKLQSVEEIRQWLEEHGGMDAHGAEISASLYDKLTRKPLNEWTVGDLEDMASYVWALEEHGRQVYLQKQTALQLERRGIQAGLIRTLKESGRNPDTGLSITNEAKAEKRKRRDRQGMLLETVNPEHVAKLLDNMQEHGAFFREFVRKKRDAQDVEWDNKARRITGVLDKLEAIGYKLDDLNRTVAYGDKHVSVAELAFAELAQRNEETKQAYSYGLLVSKTEKDAIKARREGMYETEGEMMQAVNDEIKKLGDKRYQDILLLAYTNLTGKDRQAMEVISEDLGSQIGRINEVAHSVYNMHVDGVQAYLPHFRMDVGGVEANVHQQMADMMNAEASIEADTGVFKGFTQKRIRISPFNQTPIQSNLVDVWRKSLDATEHFIAFSALNQEWNAVARGFSGRSLVGALQGYRGKAYADYLSDYMNEVVTPKRLMQGDSRLVKALRGNLPAAYLAFKPSGVILQMITSPAAFLKELNPVEYLAAVGQWMADMKGMDEFIMERSPFMRQRQGVIEQAVSDAIANDPSMPAWQRKMSRLTSIGMAGMEFADHSAVHPGWIALYRKKLRELGGVETQETMAEAARYADDIVHTTQPVSDRTEMAPLFKKGGAMGVLTQFTASMNVIWNNVTIDAVGLARQAGNKTLPAEVRMQAFRRLAGQTMGYALAGLVLGAVQQGFKGKDDDDDKGKKVRKGLYYATTQFSGATPLVGDFVDWTIEKVLTGESGYVGGDSFYPALTAMQRALSAKTPAKQAENALRALGLATGMPVSGIRQAVRAVEEKSLLPFIGR